MNTWRFRVLLTFALMASTSGAIGAIDYRNFSPALKQQLKQLLLSFKRKYPAISFPSTMLQEVIIHLDPSLGHLGQLGPLSVGAELWLNIEKMDISLPDDAVIKSITLSPRGTFAMIFAKKTDGSEATFVLDIQKNEIMHVFQADVFYETSLFSSDDRYILVKYYDKDAELYTTKNWQIVKGLPFEAKDIEAFSHDSRLVLVYDRNQKQYFIYRLEDKQKIPIGNVAGAFSFDNTTVRLPNRRLYDLHYRQQFDNDQMLMTNSLTVQAFKHKLGNLVRYVVSPNYEYVIMVDKDEPNNGFVVKFLNGYMHEPYEVVASLRGDYAEAGVNSLAFSPDSQYVAVLFHNKLVLYDTRNWQEPVFVLAQKNPFIQLVFDMHDTLLMVSASGKDISRMRFRRDPIMYDLTTDQLQLLQDIYQARRTKLELTAAQKNTLNGLPEQLQNRVKNFIK